MHGGHVAVVLQSASILQRDSVGESPRFCKCMCQQFLRMQKSSMEMKEDAIWIQAHLLHSKAKSTKILQFSVFIFRYSLRVRKLFFRDLVRVRNGSFVVPATPKTDTLHSQIWLSWRRASLGFEGLEPALGGYQNQTPSGT